MPFGLSAAEVGVEAPDIVLPKVAEVTQLSVLKFWLRSGALRRGTLAAMTLLVRFLDLAARQSRFRRAC